MRQILVIGGLAVATVAAAGMLEHSSQPFLIKALGWFVAMFFWFYFLATVGRSGK